MIWVALLVSLVLGTLAVNSTVECLHHAKIFERVRARLEADPDRIISQIWACPYCLSFHVGYVIAALLVVSIVVTVDRAVPVCGVIAMGVVLWLSITRGAQFLNDILHDKLRTPRFNVTENLGLFNPRIGIIDDERSGGDDLIDSVG